MIVPMILVAMAGAELALGQPITAGLLAVVAVMASNPIAVRAAVPVENDGR